ncbi:hypothetical protein M758_10G171900 [Ceratodon purpureus]|uniref:Uncharacterized protein n=1 Tax=Ceratodon purpureus TaxID=3225 RepID=A0A8T0GRR7_CERPU|nr:hypothetical protein KC19_10G176500 [Ceratodon purpureus]KAG0604432.1 hypothetical protein M758_10G171900 [Ceratodon purpureus]
MSMHCWAWIVWSILGAALYLACEDFLHPFPLREVLLDNIVLCSSFLLVEAFVINVFWRLFSGLSLEDILLSSPRIMISINRPA